MDKANKEVSDLGDQVEEFPQKALGTLGVDFEKGVPFKVSGSTWKGQHPGIRVLEEEGRNSQSYVGWGVGMGRKRRRECATILVSCEEIDS